MQHLLRQMLHFYLERGEAYGFDKATGLERDLRFHIRERTDYQTWANLARWCSLVNDPASEGNVSVANSDERGQLLSSGCFVNVKKYPGEPHSNNSEVAKFARRDEELLQEQLRLYKPDVTFACGTFGILQDIYQAVRLNKPSIEDGLGLYHFMHPDLGIVIDTYHPGYFRFTPDRHLQFLQANLRYHFPTRFA